MLLSLNLSSPLISFFFVSEHYLWLSTFIPENSFWETYYYVQRVTNTWNHPWRCAGALNSKYECSRHSRDPVAIGFSWMWYRSVVSGIWMKPGQYILKHCVMQVLTGGLVLQSYRGLTIWQHYTNFLFKMCSLPIKSRWMAFHNWGKIWKPNWQCTHLKYIRLSHGIFILQTMFLNPDRLWPIIRKQFNSWSLYTMLYHDITGKI